MKTFIKETDQLAERPFPKILSRRGSPEELVLASSETEGVALTDGAKQRTGQIVTDINPSQFVDFEGELLLKND